METYPVNKKIAAYLCDLNLAALERGEYWAVARVGKNTKKILGKFGREEEALRRARRYRGKAVKVYLCGYDVGIDDLPVIYASKQDAIDAARHLMSKLAQADMRLGGGDTSMLMARCRNIRRQIEALGLTRSERGDYTASFNAMVKSQED